MILRLATLMIAVSFLSACAFGNKYDYTAASASVAPVQTSMAVSVVDMRPYVLSGEKTPEWVGLQRSGLGIPYGVHTQTGRPLAHDLTDFVASSYRDVGSQATPVSLSQGTQSQEAIGRLADTGADRLLLINMTEWKTDTYFQVTAHWGLEAEVYDAGGQLLASDQIAGVRGTGDSAFLPSGNDSIAQDLARLKFGELLAKPKIAAALQ